MVPGRGSQGMDGCKGARACGHMCVGAQGGGGVEGACVDV